MDRERLNVVTLEDPVEWRLPGVCQLQVRPRAGLTFPVALRAVLRQDPDVVMVGEIRDRETAMAAAVTGHLVLSTIHTVDAPGAITRLLNMGVPPYLVAGGLTGVVAQRLVRRVCPACRGRSATGCGRCPDGYRGRVGVFQVLVMTDALRDELVRGASTARLRRLAIEAGMGSLSEDARRQVAEGVTTRHEVGRVLQSEPGSALPCRGCARPLPIGRGRVSLVRVHAHSFLHVRHPARVRLALLPRMPEEALMCRDRALAITTGWGARQRPRPRGHGQQMRQIGERHQHQEQAQHDALWQRQPAADWHRALYRGRAS